MLINDIDGGGRNEVLVRPNAVERANRRLVCLEADGRVRFVHQPTGTRYACRNCTAGGPGEFFLFASLCATRRTGQAGLLEAWVEHGDRIRVTVMQGGAEGGATYYTLGPDGSVLAGEISREFQAQHARLERQGLLDHTFGLIDDREMFPVRRRNGQRFEELPRVKVDH